MGTNTYFNGRITDELEGEAAGIKLLNGRQMQTALNLTGQHFIDTAIALFEGLSKHEDTAPEFYTASFKLDHYREDLVRAVRIRNTDRTAEWVEFGSHAGGKTAILKYRIFGRTADILEAEAAA